jgi:hypothetical protein
VLSELRSLRIELLEYKLDRAHGRIAEIQQQLKNAEIERNRLTGEERSQAQELLEIQERLSQPSLPPEARGEIEAYRTQLMAAGAARLSERNRSLAAREADLRMQLDREERVRQQLTQTHQSLGARPRT